MEYLVSERSLKNLKLGLIFNAVVVGLNIIVVPIYHQFSTAGSIKYILNIMLMTLPILSLDYFIYGFVK